MLNAEEIETGGADEIHKWPVRIVLTGFRATGKTLVGEHLARLTGYRFIDTDAELTAKHQCSVATFVREHGWSVFRKEEQELLERLTGMNGVVIATGGGTVLHEQVWKALRMQSLVVWLQADAATIRQRLQADNVSQAQRPSLTGNGKLEEVETVLAERDSFYRHGSDMAINTAERSPEEIAEVIQQHINVSEKSKG